MSSQAQVMSFLQQYWGNFLNAEPTSVVYWAALVVVVLSVVQPMQLAPVTAATGLQLSDVQKYAAFVVAVLYAKYQLQLF